MEEKLIAPCGMNCAICSGYLAAKHDVKNRGIRLSYCSGCRPRNKKCAFLKKTCSLLLTGGVKYCYECNNFPCKRLADLDQRYRSLYRMSMIENLQSIKANGMSHLLEQQEGKWKCPECGGVICCHNGICYNCGLDKLGQKKRKYRWEE